MPQIVMSDFKPTFDHPTSLLSETITSDNYLNSFPPHLQEIFPR